MSTAISYSSQQSSTYWRSLAAGPGVIWREKEEMGTEGDPSLYLLFLLLIPLSSLSLPLLLRKNHIFAKEPQFITFVANAEKCEHTH